MCSPSAGHSLGPACVRKVYPCCRSPDECLNISSGASHSTLSTVVLPNGGPRMNVCARRLALAGDGGLRVRVGQCRAAAHVERNRSRHDRVVPGALVTLAVGGTEIATTTTDRPRRLSVHRPLGGQRRADHRHARVRTVVRTWRSGPTPHRSTSCWRSARVTTAVTVTAASGKATATRPVPDVDVPAQVSTIPQELLRQQGVNTVGDRAEERVGRPGGSLVRSLRAVHHPRVFQTPIATAST